MPEPVIDAGSPVKHPTRGVPESGYAWTRLFAALVLSAIGGVGMWSVIVALPAVQAEFGVARSAASLPYTMTMICFGFGGILMGRLSDRVGIIVPVTGGAIVLGLGYAVASQATSLWQSRSPRVCWSVSPVRSRSGHSSPIPRCGSRVIAAWPCPSSRAAATWRERCGRPSCSTSSRRKAGAGPTRASPSSAWPPWCRWRWPCGGGRR